MMRTWHAWVNLVKAMAGVGIFALPIAFKQSGLWVGTVLTIALGFANADCMIKLVKCSQYLCDEKKSTGYTTTFTSKSHLSTAPLYTTNNKKDYNDSEATHSEKRALQKTHSADDNRSSR
ncbi:hypothetical protein COOONC_13714 [Cooperia oncophora]